jgi:dihydrofolate synthase/folylpolyglutamate synthase
VAMRESDGRAEREAADQVRYLELEQSLLARWPESMIDPDLSRIAAVMELLGDPQRAYPVIHLAGTNGKTSTARIIESLLRSFGLATGMFTSPHLHSMRERIQLGGDPVDTANFLAAYDDVEPYLNIVDERSVAAGGPPLSYFEAITAIAFAAFADAPVDVAVMETGMGGRWDSTNVADGQVAVITPVDLDHQAYLGDTVEQIAGEKAGIIKAGAQVVLAEQQPAAAEVLLARAEEVGAHVVREGAQFGVSQRVLAVGGQVLSIQGLGGTYDDLFLPLFGGHQARNAAVALAAVESFLGGGAQLLDIELVRAGFAESTSPGRLEIVRRAPTVIVDAAHNPHGARALVEAVRDSFDFTYLVGVLAVLRDKDVRGLLEAVEPLLSQIVVTSNSSPRSMAADELGAVAVDVFGSDRVEVALRFPDAVETAIQRADEAAAELGGGAGVLVTGSVVTAADGRLLFNKVAL